MSSSIFLVAAKRTSFGSFGGSLKAISPTELAVTSTKAALAQGNIDPSIIDTVYFGNINPSSPDAAYLARHVALKSGCSLDTPALTLNRACGSGFESVIQGANAIKIGEAQMALCGGECSSSRTRSYSSLCLCLSHLPLSLSLSSGTENMSAAPLQIDGNDARWGVPLGKGLTVRDGLWCGLIDDHVNLNVVRSV